MEDKELTEKDYYTQLLNEKKRELAEYDLDTKKFEWKQEFYKRIKPYINNLSDSKLKEEYQRNIEANDEELKIRLGNNNIKKEILLKEKSVLENLVK